MHKYSNQYYQIVHDCISYDIMPVDVLEQLENNMLKTKVLENIHTKLLHQPKKVDAT